MGFKLGDFCSPATRDALPVDRCVTGKTVFYSKAEAEAALRRLRDTTMRPFRCGYADHYHLGHRRGSRW